jgi:hypothetical protein
MTRHLITAFAACAFACAAPSIEGSPLKKPPVKPDGGLIDPTDTTVDDESGSGGIANGNPDQPGNPGVPGVPGPDGGVMTIDGNVPATDSDLDGAPDALDCDPASSALGFRVAEDDLATAKGLLKGAPGFDANAWIHSAGAYRQQMLRDAGDASFFNAPDLDGVLVEVKAASTAISTSFYPKLRQNFVVVGATSSVNDFSAYGCGVEVVEGAYSELKASVVKLTGSPANVYTSPLKRADRDPLNIDEEFTIRVKVSGGNITCTVLQAKREITVVAQGVGTVRGAVGFFTRQNKARYSNARVCVVK